jgi:hypothetical protein
VLTSTGINLNWSFVVDDFVGSSCVLCDYAYYGVIVGFCDYGAIGDDFDDAIACVLCAILN